MVLNILVSLLVKKTHDVKINHKQKLSFLEILDLMMFFEVCLVVITKITRHLSDFTSFVFSLLHQ